MPRRATIQARDGTPLAQGEQRLSKLGPLAAEIAGRVGPAEPEQVAELARRGVPADTPVGLTGLEREFEPELAGTPGGVLRAGDRVVARTEPRRGSPVRTTIDPRVQRAAVEALAGRFGGVAVLRPRDGEVLGLAGVAFSAPQPPGSVFKIITLAGALEAGVAKPSDRYPVETAATLEGVELTNANGEACGGSLRVVVRPLVQLRLRPDGRGARRRQARRDGRGLRLQPGSRHRRRRALDDPRRRRDRRRPRARLDGDRPGKGARDPAHDGRGGGRDRASGGVMPEPTLRKGDDTERSRATTARAARIIARYMRSVVTSGTGVAANIPGIRVAGKTGTAELRDTTNADPVPGEAPVSDRADTDAWFVAFAPARAPKVAVAVMLVGQGAGGETAAPAARVCSRPRSSAERR